MPAHAKKPKPASNSATPKPGQPGQAQLPGQAPVRPGEQPKPRDMADPSVVTDDATKKPEDHAYKKNERAAQLYGKNGIQASDVRQGRIADCFLAASMSAVAGARPDAIKNAIIDNKDGTYSVRFYKVDWNGEKRVSKETVDSDLPWDQASDAPAYAKSTEGGEGGKAWMELWPSILEKAYAQWKGGSYDAIGHGGNSGDVLEALTGQRSTSESTAGAEAGGTNDALWAKMKKASAEKRPMTAGSGDKDDAKYKDPKAGVYGWHAYTVLGVEEKKAGDKTEKMVTLRNPWGKRRRDGDAAAVGDSDNEKAAGVFQLEWKEFRRLYDDVTISGG
ncbi:MAG: hypothetical protein EXR79_09245 [Myxococcales bacterium]|nr:hypothetical protein [Myxococcales bacterium]